nr:Uncharacterised protein [Salmonella sp. NCTC 7297]
MTFNKATVKSTSTAPGVRIRKQTRILTKTDSNLWTVDEVRYLPGLELRRHWQETVNGDAITPQAATEALHVITNPGRTRQHPGVALGIGKTCQY